jgi:hypothetical protein
MPPETDYVVVDPFGPCPCRSGKTTVQCCMAADGSFKVKYPSPLPAGDITGFSHPDCYMRDAGDCSQQTAAGYYFSGELRDLLRTGVVRANFPWDGREQPAIATADLPAGVLCRRHNDALSSLDAVALQAFSNILDAVAYVTMKSLATKKTLCAVSGEGLELWLLKALFGANRAAPTADEGAVAAGFEPLDARIFLDALQSGALAAPRGLYFRKSATVDRRAPAPADATNGVSGLQLFIGPLECELIVDPAGKRLDAFRSQNFFRPSGIDLVGKKRSAQIHMSGTGFATNETARFAMSDIRAEG